MSNIKYFFIGLSKFRILGWRDAAFLVWLLVASFAYIIFLLLYLLSLPFTLVCVFSRYLAEEAMDVWASFFRGFTRIGRGDSDDSNT